MFYRGPGDPVVRETGSVLVSTELTSSGSQTATNKSFQIIAKIMKKKNFFKDNK